MRHKLPFFPESLDHVLRRETDGELRLARPTLRRYRSVMRALAGEGMPVIVCVYAGRPFGQWHYVVVHRAEVTGERVTFHWMDNGLYGRRDGGNPGLFTTGPRRLRGLFPWGAKVVEPTS